MPTAYCPHLQPLVDAMAAAHIDLKPVSSPYGDDNAWWACDCTFDEAGLRRRLDIDPSVMYLEYQGMAAGCDATWTCREHKLSLMGLHPCLASADTPRLR